jgi:queuine tRNA-ribosyltransferase
MSSPSLFVSINNYHVEFKNPFMNQNVIWTPEKCMEIQMNLGSDVAMCLDHMPHPVKDKRNLIADAVRRTSLWAKRCKKHHDELKRKEKSNQLLFGIVQGGLDKKLRRISAAELDAMGFDGYAIGGLGMGETKEQSYSIVDYTEQFLDSDKPRYLMGIGDPIDILDAISHGVDCLDSKYPTQHARHGYLFTSSGVLDLDKAKYALDEKPIDSNCNCYVCKTFSRAFLRHLFKLKEYTVNTYLSYHNIYFIQNMMKEVRKAIKQKKFNSYKKNFLKHYN